MSVRSVIHVEVQCDLCPQYTCQETEDYATALEEVRNEGWWQFDKRTVCVSCIEHRACSLFGHMEPSVFSNGVKYCDRCFEDLV